MQRNDEIPTYNLKVVVRETGLKHDTLRAWVRRYGLPQPQRTEGRHRLYSQRDIDTLKWLVDRQSEGLSISRAVDLWRQLEAEGQDPLLAMAKTANAVPVSSVGSTLVAGQSMVGLQEQWVQACLAFNETRAEQLLTQASALYPPELVCLEFLQKGLHTIGQLWGNGKATVQQEHFASALATRRLDTLIAATAPPTRTGRILIGCPPDEYHAFSLLVATYLLRRSGWDTIFLGANVPIHQLQDTVTTIRPNLVILAAQQFHTAGSLLETILALQQEQVVAAYGGLIFNLLPQLQQVIPGYYLGNSVDTIPQAVEHLFGKPLAFPPAKPITKDFEQAKTIFKTHLPQIEARLNEQLGVAIPPDILAGWNLNTARNLLTALTFGDMTLLQNNLLWHQYQESDSSTGPDTPQRYLAAYVQAVQDNLNQQGQPLLDGLVYLSV